MTSIKNFIQNLNPKNHYESLAAEEFKKFYGDVFVSGTTDIKESFKLSLDDKWDAFAHIYTSATLANTFCIAGSHF